jgi:hypothetical protein
VAEAVCMALFCASGPGCARGEPVSADNHNQRLRLLGDAFDKSCHPQRTSCRSKKKSTRTLVECRDRDYWLAA